MLTLSSDSLHGYGLNRIFRFVKEAKFDGIDLAMNPKEFDTVDGDYIKELVDAYKLPVLSLAASPNASAKQIMESVEVAKKIGTQIIVIQAPKIFNFKYTKWLTSEIPKIRQKEQISIALENAPAETLLGFIPGHALNNLNELRKFKHAALDTTRVAQHKEDLIRTFKNLSKFLVHVHVSNVKHGKGYQLPEEGILPLESFLTKLKQESYKGAISFKIHPKFMKAGDDKKVLENLAACKKFYEEYYVKVNA